ncbi:unnamed protein product [Lupinus luteus]|uniref:Uncharacterized protein n=1 Tax=Lupinus luteus TaxID=3873 RepID=A0AAV1X8S0_LUPLU
MERNHCLGYTYIEGMLPLSLFNDKESENGDEVNVPNTQQPQQQKQSEFEETRHLVKEFQAQGDNIALL